MKIIVTISIKLLWIYFNFASKLSFANIIRTPALNMHLIMHEA